MRAAERQIKKVSAKGRAAAERHDAVSDDPDYAAVDVTEDPRSEATDEAAARIAQERAEPVVAVLEALDEAIEDAMSPSPPLKNAVDAEDDFWISRAALSRLIEARDALRSARSAAATIVCVDCGSREDASEVYCRACTGKNLAAAAAHGRETYGPVTASASAEAPALHGSQDVECVACHGTGRVTLPPEIDTMPVYYFGCWQDLGHFLRNVDNPHMSEREMTKLMPPELGAGRGHFDGSYCPGYVKGDPYKRSRPEVEGEAKLTHVAGWTVLGWWDRSVDKRGACNSNIIVRGTHDFTTMIEIGNRRAPRLMSRQRTPITLVEGP